MTLDLILGAVDGYDFYEIEPFLVTLRQSGYSGHLVLFAGPGISARTKRRIGRAGAEVVDFVDRFPFLPSPHPENVTALPQPIHICNLRYFLYHDYLLKRGRDFRNVLISDVRDVMFQGDPFEGGLGDAVHVAMENPTIPIGECPWTGPWVVKAYGEEALGELRNKPMSCSGTTMGPIPLMINYLRLMLSEIQIMRSGDAYLDQAAHNVLIHRDGIGPVRRLENFHGPILTVGSEPAFQLNQANELVNADGSAIAIVHQYDRHPQLARLVAARVHQSALRRAISRTGFRLRRRLQRRSRRSNILIAISD